MRTQAIVDEADVERELYFGADRYTVAADAANACSSTCRFYIFAFSTAEEIYV